MSNTATRIFAGAILVVLIYCANRAVEARLKVPGVQPANLDLKSMPAQLARWRGKQTGPDAEVFAATGADSIINRVYRDDSGRTVAAHLALYSDPDAGIYHSPINCYRSSGWRLLENARDSLARPDGSSSPVSLSTWQRDGERIVVLYWFQLGEHVLFDRYGMAKVRWRMRNLETWPRMTKVLLQTSAGADVAGAKVQIKRFAQLVCNWIGEVDRTATPKAK